MTKTAFIGAGIMLAMAGCTGSLHEDSTQNFDKPFPLETPTQNSLLAKWAAKEVKDSLLIDDMEGKLEWKLNEGIASIAYETDNVVDGRSAIRYHTSLRDTAHIARAENRSPWGSFGGQQGGGASFGLHFDEPQDWSDYNRVTIWVYIHPSANPNHHFFLEIINDSTDYNTVTPRKDTAVQDITAGHWHKVIWEIANMQRDKVKSFNIFQTLIGFDDEIGEEFVTYDFDRLMLERVDADNYEGWSVPEGQFAFSHIGYRPEDSKVALTAAGTDSVFSLADAAGHTVFSAPAKTVNSKNGNFASLDFTGFSTPGYYTIRYGKNESKPFPINSDVWLEPLFCGLNFYFCQRCGHEVPGIHGVCHKDWQGFYGDEKKQINGGWHDAGDLSQGYYRTAMGAYALMRNLALTRQDPSLSVLSGRIADEAAWGVDWLMKTRFADGHHISWARQRIYSDNITGTIDDVVIQAQNVPWENFLGAAVLTMASEMLYPEDSDKKQQVAEAAVDNWTQACASVADKTEISYLEAAWGATSSSILFKKTLNPAYRDAAIRFGKALGRCQEKEFVEGIPVTGYFYTDTSRSKPVYNNHGAFNEAPMIALRTLCETFPDEPEWIDWYAAAAIYADCFMKTGSEIAAPFDLLPNAVYRKADMLAHPKEYNRKYNMIQYDDGTRLNDNYAIRTFPIWDGELFHGGTSCHLSSSWALAEASQLRNDSEGLRLVGEQLEWTFGRNPFDQTLMYGVGYNFTPLFAYCTRNIVGALPVGMDCMKDDKPYWHGSAYATSKEIWIAPVNRFMGTVAAYREPMHAPSAASLRFENSTFENGCLKAELVICGKGETEIALRLFNATGGFAHKTVNLAPEKETRIPVCLEITDGGMPAVAVATADGRPAAELGTPPRHI